LQAYIEARKALYGKPVLRYKYRYKKLVNADIVAARRLFLRGKGNSRLPAYCLFAAALTLIDRIEGRCIQIDLCHVPPG
jgi:hypothetical protein